ncbi:type II CRISPR RNA-guided endonuclease Cas9 [Geomobilimonas luticola]|uniref:CRISPR-associated endonuclease Cas9 n=1 Tax=Geomobilimonas luticola TaxID=1114878 RepID=A0ABS5SHI4_9BACT|nr:type II CRISPR RNA-guided endonuclease Cas9 [Geomobilimonas luticola]MBT0654725.1 type II CRISPR RNA-guided endonuclease Cas9 [Geomobilimonas luticola]
MHTEQLILGLDIGTNSIGWALLKAELVGERFVPVGIEKTGVRIFEAGVAGSIEQGRTESHAKARREARMLRRGVFRDGQRLRRAFRLLQEAGLLPGDPNRSSERDRIVKKLDADLRETWERKLIAEGMDAALVKIAVHHNLPYFLRARGLDEKLELYEIGRTFYQLAQRRGFKSARKNIKGKDDADNDPNTIEKAAKGLQEEMAKVSARTMGEYFARYNPFESVDRKIRGLYTLRAMYEQEFDLLWNSQAQHYPEILTPSFRQNLLYDVYGVFWQRSLKDQSHLVGDCTLEQGEKRAAWALLDAQRFRYLQKLNDTRIIPPDGGEPYRMAPEQYDILASVLDREAGLTMTRAKELLGLTNRFRFNMGEGGETRFVGNRTAAKFIEILGDRWQQLSSELQHRLVADYLKSKDSPAPMQRSITELGLDEKIAKKLAAIKLEPGYCNFSRKALTKLLPHLQEGFDLHDSIVHACYKRLQPEPLDLLPPLMDNEKIAYPPLLQAYGALRKDIRNPVVQRALTELRKVVNAIVRRYGKPAVVRIELARDMKKNDEQRREIWKRNRDQETHRAKAAAELLKECNIADPTRSDIEKVLLWQECGGPTALCPYTGAPMTLTDLFGTHPKFDIEHIIPFSISLDDSFLNKTLCDADYNRRVKANKMPSQLAGVDEMIERLKHWPKSDTRDIKLERFKMEDTTDIEGFVNSQLNDTRYASRLAMDYVGMLYGGKVDVTGRTRVQVGKGQITHHIRNVWRLNTILNDGGQKSRDDHRHHAVDAVAIALTEPKTIKSLSDIAKRAKERGERWFGREKPLFPWQNFMNDVAASIHGLTVSHRVSHKVNTAFHEQTIYSREKEHDGKKYVHIRRTLGGNLRKTDLVNIVDEKIRETVLARLRELGYEPEKIDDQKLLKAFTTSENLPYLLSKTGRQIPVKKVRVRKAETVITVGNNGCERNVSPGSNSHIEIFEVTDNKGKVKWDGWTVNSYEALLRQKNKQPIVNRIGKDDSWKFKMSLAGGDIIELQTAEDKRKLFVIKVISVARVNGKEYPRIMYTPINSAKPERQDSSLLDPLRKQLKCRKVRVSPLGEVYYGND